MTSQDKSFVIRTAAITLAVVIVGMVGVLLAGLFDPVVDNDKIFDVLTPSFQTVIGCFVGLLAGLTASRSTSTKEGD